MTPSTLTSVREPLPAGPNHAVQFYESDDFLRDSVADFIANGLVATEPVVVIATEAHRQAFASALQVRGLDVAEASASGDLLMVDASEALPRSWSGSCRTPIDSGKA
jgi:MEDS: MEthanogen/methylotroph, DcmR Sensory domain